MGPHNYAIRVTIFIPKIVMNNSFTRKTCTKMMKPCQTLLQESTQRKGEKKESRGKDQSPSKHACTESIAILWTPIWAGSNDSSKETSMDNASKESLTVSAKRPCKAWIPNTSRTHLVWTQKANIIRPTKSKSISINTPYWGLYYNSVYHMHQHRELIISLFPLINIGQHK